MSASSSYCSSACTTFSTSTSTDSSVRHLQARKYFLNIQGNIFYTNQHRIYLSLKTSSTLLTVSSDMCLGLDIISQCLAGSLLVSLLKEDVLGAVTLG